MTERAFGSHFNILNRQISLLAALVQHYPNTVTSEQLRAEMPDELCSRTFLRYMKALLRLGIVERVALGEYRLAKLGQVMFIENVLNKQQLSSESTTV